MTRRSATKSGTFSGALLPIALDFCAILFSWAATVLITESPFGWKLFLVAVLTFQALQLSSGVYRMAGVSPPARECGLATRSFVLGIATLSTFLFFFVGGASQPERFLIFFIILPGFYLLCHAPRWYRDFGKRHRGNHGIRTMVIGADQNASRLTDLVVTMPRYNLVAVQTLNGAGPQRFMSDLKQGISESDIELLLLSSHDLNGSIGPLRTLEDSAGVMVRVVPSEAEFLSSHTGIDDLTAVPLSPISKDRNLSGPVHRVFDLAVATVLSIVMLPLLVMVALATRLTSKGPVFFRQSRSMNGIDTPFTVYKFRSMKEGADAGISMNESVIPRLKTREDPRVTTLGRFMRRYSIDELPQLLNIFKGEMSLIGPRPLPEEDFRAIGDDDINGHLRTVRSGVRPGLTGLWQISGRSDLGFREMILLDLYYIEHRSLLFDLEILLKTFPAVIFGKGAY